LTSGNHDNDHYSGILTTEPYSVHRKEFCLMAHMDFIIDQITATSGDVSANVNALRGACYEVANNLKYNPDTPNSELCDILTQLLKQDICPAPPASSG